MTDRTNHRRVLHFAVTGVLLGAMGCTSNEPAKDAKGEPKADAKGEAKDAKQPEPDMKFAPNPGPNELDPKPEPPIVAPTTAVKEPPPVEEDHVNEGPVEEPKEPVPVGINEGPQKAPEPKPVKRVNPGPVKEPEKPAPIKINPGPEG